MMEEPIFTAAEIAKPLNRSRQSVLKAMAKLPTAPREKTVRGIAAAAWPLSALPLEFQEILKERAKDLFHPNAEHLLSDPSPQWKPSIPYAEVHEDCIAEAHERRKILEPVLRVHHEKCTHEIVRAALQKPNDVFRSARMLRQWIDTVKARDHGRLEFWKPELYLDGHLKRKDSKEAPAHSPCQGMLAEALNRVADLLNPTPAELAGIWFAACYEFRLDVSAGDDSRASKSRIVSVIEASRVAMVKARSADAASDRHALNVQFDRKLKRSMAEGWEGMGDKRKNNPGPKPAVELNEAEEKLAKKLYLHTESKTSALRMLAQSPDCRPEVAAVILKKRSSKHKLTPALRNQIALPEAVRAYHKSPKDVRVNSFICPRKLTYIDATGEEKKILPGDLFERDDMSNNFLCWVPWPWGGDPCSDKYGVRLARGQNLLMIDVASLFFTSFNFLIRLRDSYRADDIWQWVGNTYQDIGMPRIGERWERGTWKSKKLRGEKGNVISPGVIDEGARLGGMESLGLKIIESQSPTTKIIENRFRFFQRACSTIHGQIGAVRGEMEHANKVWTACRLGHRDPREYFLSFDQASNAIEEKLHWVNSEPVEGQIYNGVPQEVWSRGCAAAPLQKLPSDKSYLFSRDKADVTCRKGHVCVRYTAPDGTRESLFFHHPELYRYDGLKIAVHHDRYMPGEGATLVAAQGPDHGTVIGRADLVEGCPQFALGAQAGYEIAGLEAMFGAAERKRDFTNAVRSEYRALDIGGRRIARRIDVDDGAGKVSSISQQDGAESLPIASPASRGSSAAPARPSREQKPAEAPRRVGGGLMAALFDADPEPSPSIEIGNDLMNRARGLATETKGADL